MTAPLAAALLCCAPLSEDAPAAGGETLPVVRTVEMPAGVPVPPQTLRVEDRGGWVVVSLTVGPPADPPAADDGEGEEGGAFGDSADAGEDEEEKVPAARPAAGPEWVVALCEVDPAVTPQIVAGEGGSVAVQYGPYFVRDDVGRLRVLRQPKPAPADPADVENAPAWALGDLPADPSWSGWGGSAAVRLTAMKQGGWFWTLSQPHAGLREAYRTINKSGDDGAEDGDNDATAMPADVLVRVAPAGGSGYGTAGYGNTLTEFSTFGDDGVTVRDEGDLLTADRTPSWMPALTEAADARAAAREAARAGLADNPAPPLPARPLTAAGEPDPDAAPLDLAALRGDVVLLDFWATWCGPCVGKLPKVNELHEKYAGDGLKVVGVHLADGADAVPGFLEDHEVAFPLAVAPESAAEAYGLSYVPTYVLIDRDGTIRREPSSSVPTPEEIEAALARPAEKESSE